MVKSRNINLKLSYSAQRNLAKYSARHGTTHSAAIDKILRGLHFNKKPVPAKPLREPLVLSRGQVLAIRERIDDGENYRALAREFKCGLATIQRAYHGKGAYGEFRYGNRRPAAVSLCRQVRQHKAQGLSYRQISRTLPVSESTAKRIVLRMGPYADR